jgi:monooxygenase
MTGEEVPVDHHDVLIVGGGLSGICAGVNLQKNCPRKTYVILESRENIGGTWDLFRYPGIRSDSDMFTLGYSFKPWTAERAIADGDTILTYLKDTAREYGIDAKIRFNHRVMRASWSSESAVWTIEAERGPAKELVRFTCRFLLACSGYYDYAGGHTPAFPGFKNFAGTVVHPQQWPGDLRYAGKRVVVIGSGATAITLVPQMARTAALVTMLQRSPSYVVARPYQDAIAGLLRRHLSPELTFKLIRWKNILLTIYFFGLCKRRPERAKKLIFKGVQHALGSGEDVAKHFTPRYNPWDQRMCLVPDGDLFEAIKSGKVNIATDEIEAFTENGIKLRSGAELEADIIVTATGLNLVVLGGVQFSVDGRAVDFARTLNYKGSMFGGVPNFASVFGYTNASWTLKCELTCGYVCRLLSHMDKKGYQACVPQNEDASIKEERWLNLSSGYIQRALDKLPKRGSKLPWKLRDNYVLDAMSLRTSSVDDGVMRFSISAAANK